MKRIHRNSTDSIQHVESLLRNHYVGDSADEPSTDFRKLASLAISRESRSSNDVTDVHSIRSRRSLPLRMMYSAAGVLLAAGILRVSFQMAPNLAQMAYASIPSLPISKFLIGPEDVGLLQLANQGKIQSMDISASSSGIVTHVVGSYADSLRTVVFLRVDPPKSGPSGHATWLPDMQGLTLTDQFGHRYPLSSSTWSIDGNQGVIEFHGIPKWRVGLGARLHLNIQGFQWVSDTATDTGNTGPHVHGTWSATWIQASSGAERRIQPDSVSTSHGITLSLTTVDLSPSAAKFTVTSTNAAAPPTPGTAASATKGAPPAIYVERVSTGEHISIFSGGFTTYGRIATGQYLASTLNSPGAYELVIHRFNGVDGLWELPFTIQ